MMSNLWAYIKGFYAALWVLVPFWVGITFGWLTHPAVWWLSLTGPWRVLGLLTARANRESGFNVTSVGDRDLAETSVGILQFQPGTWEALSGLDDSQRSSPLLSGYYGVAMLQAALFSDWRWWVYLRLPVFGFAALGHLWTHGSGSSSAASVWSDAWTDTALESSTKTNAGISGNAWKGYAVYGLALFGTLGLMLGGGMFAVWRRYKPRRRK